MINNGIPSKKIVVGKPATQADASNTGIVSSVDLGNWCVKAYQELNWTAGVMFWQYKSDGAGTIINNAAAQLIKAIGGSSTVIPVTTNTTTNTTNVITNTTTTNTTNVVANTTTTNTTNISTIPIPPSGNRISYPIRFIYVDSLNSWWPASAIAAGMATPGFAQNHTYNYVALAFWTTGGSADTAKVWENPIAFMGT